MATHFSLELRILDAKEKLLNKEGTKFKGM